MTKTLEKLNWYIDKIEDILLTYLMIIMTSVIFLQVIMRYIFNNSFTWCEEFSVICFMWITWIGASNGVKKGTHIRILILIDLLNEKTKKIFMLIIDIIWFLFTLLLVKYGWQMVLMAYEFNRRTPALDVPMAFNYLSVILGGTCMAIGLTSVILTRLRTLTINEPEREVQ
ncbi:MAG: TRAP transporter small permease [Synergistota bacterium]|nr:TRAP transporter small permease [Synergistota bacterium]